MVCKIQKGYFVIIFINISVKSTDYEGRRKQGEKIKTKVLAYIKNSPYLLAPPFASSTVMGEA